MSIIKTDILIVGAGIAGLMAGRQLQRSGYSVVLVDKGRGVGGRMATRRIGNGRADHGAQFFTVRHELFTMFVDDWLTRGLVQRWSTGWSRGSAYPPTQDGHPRYVGSRGMTTVPKHLAADLDVQISTKLVSITAVSDQWHATAENGIRFHSRALLMTPPVPQTLALLDAGQVALHPYDRAALDRIQYNPCLAGMFQVQGDVALPEPGAVQRPDHTFPWIADNQRKGISETRLITVHANPELSWALWDADADTKIAALHEGVHPFLAPNAQVTKAQVHRWRYAIPTTLHPQRTLLAQSVPPLAFAGDAFQEPRVEGAALSGLAAANALRKLRF